LHDWRPTAQAAIRWPWRGRPKKASCRCSGSQHGFRSYSVAIDGNEVLSLSVWDSRADAEAGSELAADFVRNNMAGQLEMIETRYGDVAFSTTLGVSTMASATA